MIDGTDLSMPDTFIVEAPPLVTSSSRAAALLLLAAATRTTPSRFLEFECRLDCRDPELWLECFNPTVFSNLTTGQHTLEVRAVDGNENIDPTPARYTWTVGLAPPADPGAGQLRQREHHADRVGRRLGGRGQPDRELPVRDGARGALRRDRGSGRRRAGRSRRTHAPSSVPAPAREPRRTACSSRRTSGSTQAEARPAARSRPSRSRETWKESTLTWFNQPDAQSRRRGDDGLAPRATATSSSTSSATCSRCSSSASTTAG